MTELHRRDHDGRPDLEDRILAHTLRCGQLIALLERLPDQAFRDETERERLVRTLRNSRATAELYRTEETMEARHRRLHLLQLALPERRLEQLIEWETAAA